MKTHVGPEGGRSAAPAGRVLILAPTGRDAALAAEALAGAGVASEVCADADALCRAMTAEAGAALIASEALTPAALRRLAETQAGQPAWSDLPLIVLTGGGAGRGRPPASLDLLRGATLLERPLRVATLIHAAQAALGARRRQYEVRGHLEEHVRLERQLQAESRRQRALLREVLASVTGGRLRLCDSRADLPPSLAGPCHTVALSPSEGLGALRRATKRAAVAGGLADDRWQDLLTAVGEAAMNAVVHAGGGEGRVCAAAASGAAQDPAGPADGGGTVQVWVEDRGTGIDVADLPRAALSKGYTTAGSLGHGMKMMLESVDRVWLLTGPAGTTVVMEQDRLPPKPAWY